MTCETGVSAGPPATTVREINAEEHHNPPTSMRSLFRLPLPRRAAASFNMCADVLPLEGKHNRAAKVLRSGLALLSPHLPVGNTASKCVATA